MNVRGRDIGSFVSEAQAAVERTVTLPPGYVMRWGGLWENLESGRNRLLIAVPVTFLLIFFLLFVTFESATQAALVFTGIPFAVTGGVLAQDAVVASVGDVQAACGVEGDAGDAAPRRRYRAGRA